MINRRSLTTVVLAATLLAGMAACGADDDTRPLPSSGTIEMEESATPTTPSTPSAGVDPEDVPIDRPTSQRLERIALDEVGGGRVEEIERSDESTHAYEVEVELPDDDATVEIAEDFEVVRVDR